MRYERPEVNETVVDGAAMTFGEFSKVELGDKVSSLLACAQQLGMVFNVYQKGSHKRETREGRDKKDGVRLSIKENTPIYRKFSKVLKLDNNKTEIFNRIADTLFGLFRNQQKVLLITRQQTVLSNGAVNLEGLQPCYKEEKDNRISLHPMEQSRLGFKRLMVVKVDTDVMVISMHGYWSLNVTEL